MALGDQLSPERKKQIARETLAPGCILHLRCDFFDPPKNKFLVVGCIEPAPILFAINSRVSPYITARQHLTECQVMLYQSAHSFLKYDSFLDCTTAICDFSIDDLVDQLSQEFTNMKGRLKESDLQGVIQAVSRSVTLETRIKQQVLQSLRPE